ncbi:MAG: F0F1 ATP synthase subunit delta [Burkholderiales bacterium]|nr:F0F1 ATP synthase subunit delta [Burkholderiales bacterium]
MAEPSTIARPYAEAAFRLADSAGKLGAWSDILANLSKVTVDPGVAMALKDPNLSAAKTAGLLTGILSGQLDREAENLVRVLADNRRLELLPEIASQFERLKNEREGVLDAEIVSALPLASGQLEALVSRLEARTGKRVKPHVRVDHDLIAGVRVLIGDKVIDGSVRAQLHALEAALKQ